MTTFGAVAARLAENGYLPVPIKNGTKRPPMTEWPSFRLDDAALRQYRHLGTGLLTGQLVDCDIDVLHEAAAAELHALARTELGEGPARVGQPPKILIAYRTPTPFRKRQTRTFIIGGKATKVEMLADGQQFVAYAVHPDTKQPYHWLDGDPLAIPFADLPEISEQQIATFIARAEAVLGKYGKPEKPDRTNGGGEHNQHQQAADDPAMRAYAEAAFADEVRRAAMAGRGNRNAALNVAALKLGQLVAAGWLDQGRVEESLKNAADACGLARDDGLNAVQNTIKSGLKTGMAEPREPPARTTTYRSNGATQPSCSQPANDAFPPEPESPSWQDDTMPHLSEAGSLGRC